ncbi:MAG TPA: hypothetical protein VK688_07750 [Gemmatimonadales bacterium]|nr:hypothetical protein [Gemmatimonadales bacterium]
MQSPRTRPAGNGGTVPATVMGSPAALGFRVKSGWATAVLLLGPAESPSVVEAGRVELSDASVPHSRQPHHAATGVAQTDPAVLAHLTGIVEQCARRSVAQLVERHRAAGHRLIGAGIVVGSDSPPDRIANPHIRAHASEGRLFRTALESALTSAGVSGRVVVERTLYATAAATLHRAEPALKQAVTAMGRGRTSSWRADDKAAALAAWLVLAGGVSMDRS